MDVLDSSIGCSSSITIVELLHVPIYVVLCTKLCSQKISHLIATICRQSFGRLVSSLDFMHSVWFYSESSSVSGLEIIHLQFCSLVLVVGKLSPLIESIELKFPTLRTLLLEKCLFWPFIFQVLISRHRVIFLRFAFLASSWVVQALFHRLFSSLRSLLKSLMKVRILLDLIVALNRFLVCKIRSNEGLGRFDESSALRIELAKVLHPLCSGRILDFGSLRPVKSWVTLGIMCLELNLFFTSRVAYGSWLRSCLVGAPWSRSASTSTLKICCASTITIFEGCFSPSLCLFLFLIEFFLSGKNTGWACRGLHRHWYHHSVSLWCATITLPSTYVSNLVQTEIVASSRNWWFTSLNRRLSTPSWCLIFYVSILAKKVPLHLDIDNLTDVFFVELLYLSDFLDHELLLLLNSIHLRLFRSTRIVEESSQVLLDIFHLILGYRIAVLIFQPFLKLLMISSVLAWFLMGQSYSL